MKAFWFHLKLICVFASIYGNISSRSTCEATGEKKVWIFLKVRLRNPSILLKRSFIAVSGFTWSFYSFVNLIHLKPSRFFFGVVLHLWYLYNLKKCNWKVFPKRRKKKTKATNNKIDDMAQINSRYWYRILSSTMVYWLPVDRLYISQKGQTEVSGWSQDYKEEKNLSELRA